MGTTDTNAYDRFLDDFLRGEVTSVDAWLAAQDDVDGASETRIRSLLGARSEAEPGNTGNDEVRIRIPGFEIESVLGSGASGVVYRARDLQLGRVVALKVLTPEVIGGTERQARFEREARAIARLRHPNLVTLYGAGSAGALRYLILEVVEGQGLDEWIREAASEGRRIPLKEILRIAAGLAHGLAAAHEGEVTHRDVKPSNVRVLNDGTPKLIDFGLATDDAGVTLTETGTFRGSPLYASPEQVGLSGAAIGKATDLYSLGVTLYEMLTGTVPFRGETREQLFRQILEQDAIPVRRFDRTIPKDVETLVLAALSKRPEERPRSMSGFAADLEAVVDGRPISLRPVSPLVKSWRWMRRKPVAASLLIALVLGAPTIAGLGWYIARNRQTLELGEAEIRRIDKEHALELAYMTLGEGSQEDAALEFERILSSHPHSPEALAGLFLARVGVGDDARASQVIEGLPPDVLSPGMVRQLRVMLPQVKPAAESAIEASGDPRESDFAVEAFVRGVVALRRGHLGAPDAWGTAIQALEEAILRSPSRRGLYLFELGHAAWHAKDHELARRVARVINEEWPNHPAAHYSAGRALTNADPKDAVALLRRAVAVLDNEPVRDLLAHAHSNAREFEEAARVARENVQRNPTRSKGYSLLATILITGRSDESRIAEARKALEEGVRLAPTDHVMHSRLGEVCDLVQDHSAARLHHHEAIRLAPRTLYRTRLATSALRSGDQAAAQKILEETIAADPKAGSARAFLANMLSDQGRHQEALKLARLAARLEPEESHIWYTLGCLARDARENAEAASAFKRTLALDPNNAQAIYYLATALRDLGDFEGAQASMNRAHELGTKSKTWKHPSGVLAKEYSGYPLIAKHLEAWRSNPERPRFPKSNPKELALAGGDVSIALGRFVEAATFLEEALSGDPALNRRYRIFAAESALAAGLGKGIDAPAAPKERADLRARAEAWLAADLDALERALEESSERGHSQLEYSRKLWRNLYHLPRFLESEESILGLRGEEEATWLVLRARYLALRNVQIP